MPTSSLTRRVLAACAAGALCLGVAASTTAAAAQRATPMCSAAGLSAKQTDSVGGMSQPAAYITVTNTSGQSCTLKGYPTITSASTKKGTVQIAVSRGNIMNAPSTKPRLLTLAPGGHAWFALGTATAFDPPLVTITRATIATAPGTSVADSAVVTLSQQATGLTGKPIPVTVTAFAPGIGKAS